MKIIPYALTDVGRKRDHNEDSYLVRDDVGLFAVADGMGGHQAGERASRMALDTLAGELKPPEAVTDRKDVLACLRQATQSAGAAIFDAAQADPSLQGMGTTLTSLWFHGGRAYLAHVGDSRAYLFRDGRMQQLSDDHSWVSEQVRAGMMTEDEARESKFRHIITRSVGFEREVLVDGAAIPVQAGDCYLICSDGLSNYVETDELARILTSRFYREVPRLLVELANDRGGDDNITVVLIHVANDATNGSGNGAGKLDMIAAGGDGKAAAKADSDDTAHAHGKPDAKAHDAGKADAKAHDAGKADAKTHDAGKADAKARDAGKADARTHGDARADAKTHGDARADSKAHSDGKPDAKPHGNGKAGDGKHGNGKAGDGKPRGARGKKGGGR